MRIDDSSFEKLKGLCVSFSVRWSNVPSDELYSECLLEIVRMASHDLDTLETFGKSEKPIPNDQKRVDAGIQRIVLDQSLCKKIVSRIGKRMHREKESLHSVEFESPFVQMPEIAARLKNEPELAQQLAEFVANLSRSEKELLFKYQVEKLTPKQIASDLQAGGMEISAAAVSNRISRLRNKIKRFILDDGNP